MILTKYIDLVYVVLNIILLYTDIISLNDTNAKVESLRVLLSIFSHTDLNY
jgi:hypothetical protein